MEKRQAAAYPREAKGCRFCQIAAKEAEASVVFDDDVSLAFLDFRPLFPGHCLLIPKVHYETLGDLPNGLTAQLFLNAKKLAAVVQSAMEADGTFLAINNKISQSVPHFHIHIVPRRKGDGLRGFFWPRQKYENAAAMESVQRRLAAELSEK